MAYKVVEIYKDLPRRAGCSDCGKPGCFAFATAAHLEGLSFDRCPHLSLDARKAMEAKAEASRAQHEGPREAPEEQAASLLQHELATADLGALAQRARARHLDGPPEAVGLELFDRSYEVRRDAVIAVDGGEVDVWVKVVLLMYLTRGTGAEPKGTWIAYRDLPNTISKQATFEKWVDRIPRAYAGRFDELAEAARRLGGERVAHDSADQALRFQALPLVPLLLLLWDADADFEARGSLLLDAGVLDFLDQEALTFLAEALMRLLASPPAPLHLRVEG